MSQPNCWFWCFDINFSTPWRFCNQNLCKSLHHITRNWWRLRGRRDWHSNILHPLPTQTRLWIENTLYTPSCPSCLLCPQQLHEQSVLKGPNNANFATHAQGASLTHEGEHFDFPFHPKTKLPIITVFRNVAMPKGTTSHSSKPHRLTHSAHQANPDEETISLMDPNDLLPSQMWRPTPDITFTI